MNEQLKDKHQPPWNMPSDVFWDHGEFAELNRLQWIQENHPDLTLEEIFQVMPFRDDVVTTFIEEKHMIELIKTAYESEQNEKHEALYRQRLFKLSIQAMNYDPESEEKIEI